MAWSKLEDTYYDDAKFRRLASILKLGDRIGDERGMVLAQGHVSRLWSWAGRHAPDGFLPLASVSDADIERVCGWSNAGGRLVAGMIAAGFLDEHADETQPGRVIHRFWERAESHKAAIKKRKQRESKEPVPGQSRPPDDPRPGHVPVRGEERRGEEQRGEEINAKPTLVPSGPQEGDDPNSLASYQVQQIPIEDAKHVHDAWTDELDRHRHIQMPPIPSPKDIHNFRHLVLRSGGNRDIAAKIARAWVHCEDPKGYFKKQGWAPWLLLEERNFSEARAKAAVLMKKGAGVSAI